MPDVIEHPSCSSSTSPSGNTLCLACPKLTDVPFDDKDWIFEDKYDGFRMIATIDGGEVTHYSRNSKIISHNHIEVAKALGGIKHDAVIDGELD